MRTTPRAFGASFAAVLAVGLTIAACSDSESPVAPPVELPGGALSALTCHASTQTLTVVCQGPQLDAVGSQLIIGGQNQYVRMASSNVQAVTAAGTTTFSFDATVENLLRNPWAATLDADSFAAHPEGVRVFFQQAPVSAQGVVTVANPDGQGTFTGSETDYYQYNVVDRPTTADSMPLFLNEVSASKTWVFTMPDVVTTFDFTVLIATEVPFVDGWTDVVEDTAVWERALEDTVQLPLGGSQALQGAVRSRVGKLMTGATIDYQSSDVGVATVDGTGFVSAVSPGQTVVSGTSGVDKPSYRRTRVIVMSDLRPDSAWALENVALSIGGEGVLANDSASGTLAVVPETKATMGGGEVTLNADGTFTYTSQPGETAARDSFFYRATEAGAGQDSAQVVIKLDPRDVWFVQGGATGGNGTQTKPFGTVTAAQAAAADGDSILLMESATDIDDTAFLKNGQALVGAGIAASITHTFSADPNAVNLNPGGVVTVLAAGTAPRISPSGAGAALTLANTNQVNGLDLSTFDGAAIAGNSFGTLNLSDVSVNADGPALSLTGGAANAAFDVLTSSGSGTQGLFLSGVTGSVSATSGTISSVTGTGIDLVGGSVVLIYPGAVTQGSNAALLSVSGNHTGTLLLSGALAATAGTGLQFNDADGSYTLSGSVTLNGGDAGVDIGNGSDGVFTFDDTDINSPSGTAFAVNGSTATVLHSGDIAQANNALLVSVTEEAADSVVFRSGTLSATNGGGILLSNADGTVRFLGTVTLAGGDAGVDVLAGSSGTVAFPATSSITNPTGTALNIFESAPTLTYPGTIGANAGMAVVVDGASPCGTVTVSGNITSTGQGILVRDCSAGVVEFSGTSKSLSTGGNPAVSLINNAGGTVRFSGGGLAITTTSGAGFAASTGGEVTVTGANNTISSGTGTALNLNGVSTGLTGVVFADVDNGAASSAIVLTSLTGAGVTVSGGTITGTTGHAVTLSSLASLTSGVALSNLNVTTSGSGVTPLNGSAFGALSLTSSTLSATNGPAIALNTGSLSSSAVVLNSSASTSFGAVFTGVTGTLNVSSGTIAGGAGAAFLVNAGTFGGTVGAAISQANAQPLVQIAAGHAAGTLTFSGAVSATLGTGLQFTDADGTYNFTGNLNLDGAGDEGIDIAAASAGSVNVNPSGGNTAAITSPSGVAIDVAGGSGSLSYRGNVTQASNAALLNVAGGHTGTIAFPTGTLTATNGSGLQFNNADGTYDFDGTVNLSNSVGGADAGIDISNGSGGTFTFPTAATISNPLGSLITIASSAPSFTYSGGLTKNNNATTAISLTSNTGGAVLFNGDATSADGDPADVARSFSTSTAVAVNFTGNSGTTLTFSGGGLNIATTSGAGFNATGGGTVEVTGAGNVAASTGGGTPVNIQNTTISGNGVTFYSVNASGSGTNGIVLSNTGSGGFQVTGDGASDESNTTRGRTTAKAGGGSIALGSGGSISGRSGHGVSLSSTGAVTLRNMVITGSGSSGDGINASTTGRVLIDNTRITGHASDHGILGSSMGGLAIHHSEVDNNGTTVGVVEGPDIWNIRLLGVTGTDTIRNSNIHHSQENVLGIINTSGTLNLTVLNTNITDTGTGAGGTTALMVAANGSSNITLNLQNDSINRGRSRGIQIGTEAASSAVLNFTVNNSQFRGNGGSIDLSHGSSGTNTFSITNNNIQAVAGSLQAIIVNRAASPSFNSFGLFTGTVSGNTIGTAGTAGSGSDTSNGIEVESNGSGGITRVAVVNNTVREAGLHGISVAAVDGNLGGTAPPLLEARVAGNTISNLDPVALDGINVLPGALSTDDVTVCLDIVNNNSTGIRNGLRVRASGLPQAPATVQLEGWDGVTAVNTYFTSRPNTLAGPTPIFTQAPPAPGGFVAVASCNTP